MTRVVFSVAGPTQREHLVVHEPPESVVAALAAGTWAELTQDLGRGRSARVWVNPAAVRYVLADERDGA